MLYDKAGRKFGRDKDVYDVLEKPLVLFNRQYEGTDFRRHFKVMLLTLINAKDRETAIKSLLRTYNRKNRNYNSLESDSIVLYGNFIRNPIRSDFEDLVEGKDFYYAYKFVKFKKTHVERMISAFTKYHTKIRNYFFSDQGAYLQYLDSRIAERIMLTLAEDDIVCIPIHDSFIVQAIHKKVLKKAMIESYKFFVGKTPVVK